MSCRSGAGWSRNKRNNLTTWLLSKGERLDDPADRYRHTFARILVLGGILKKLHGRDRDMFERWGKTEIQDNEDSQTRRRRVFGKHLAKSPTV